jgi:hypothetical protein
MEAKGLRDVEDPTFSRQITGGGEGVSLMERPYFTLQEEAWSTPGSWCVIIKTQDLVQYYTFSQFTDRRRDEKMSHYSHRLYIQV